MITSKENKIIKYINSLSLKKYRDESAEYVVEGIKMSLEATEYSEISYVVICEELLNSNDYESIKSVLKKKISDESVVLVSKSVFSFISDTKTPQGILVVAKKNKKNISYSGNIFVLDEVQDPGNVGTIIRSLDSAGFSNLILSKGCADPYNPKVVRSTMGAIFRVDIEELQEELVDKINKLKSNGYKIVVTSLDTNKYYYDIDFNEKVAIVIGNESKGVSKEIQTLADYKVKIPMIGKTESLNAAVATSIIAYEKVRKSLTKE